MSLHAIWISCGRPNPEIRANDMRRKDVVTMAASALHMAVSCVGRSFTLGSLYKRMLEYTRHAWHEDEACYKAALQVCSDYEDGTRFGTVRRTTSGGYNMQRSTSWILTLIHGLTGGGCMYCGCDLYRGFQRSSTSSLQRRSQHARSRKVRDHVRIISLTRLHPKFRKRRR